MLQFERILSVNIKHLLPRGAAVLCALSGGADSVAMTLALYALREIGCVGAVSCAHFNHGLRGEDSDGDAEFCKSLCERLGLPFYSQKAEHGIRGGEAEYRSLRYDFLIKTAQTHTIPYVATAHTSDDNAETILLNLTRGTGLDGLTGIPALRQDDTGVRIIRPILHKSRAQVLEYLSEKGLDFREDTTNNTDDYTRNRVRHNVVPELLKENPRLLETLSQTAELLRRDADYLNEQAKRAYAKIALPDNAVSLRGLAELPVSISGRIIRLLYESAAGSSGLPFKHTEAVLALCAAEPPAAVQLPGGFSAYREGDALFIKN